MSCINYLVQPRATHPARTHLCMAVLHHPLQLCHPRLRLTLTLLSSLPGPCLVLHLCAQLLHCAHQQQGSIVISTRRGLGTSSGLGSLCQLLLSLLQPGLHLRALLHSNRCNSISLLQRLQHSLLLVFQLARQCSLLAQANIALLQPDQLSLRFPQRPLQARHLRLRHGHLLLAGRQHLAQMPHRLTQRLHLGGRAEVQARAAGKEQV